MPYTVLYSFPPLPCQVHRLIRVDVAPHLEIDAIGLLAHLLLPRSVSEKQVVELLVFDDRFWQHDIMSGILGSNAGDDLDCVWFLRPGV